MISEDNTICVLDSSFQMWNYNGSDRIGIWDQKTYCYKYIEFKETSIDSIKGKTKQLSQTVKVNN